MTTLAYLDGQITSAYLNAQEPVYRALMSVRDVLIAEQDREMMDEAEGRLVEVAIREFATRMLDPEVLAGRRRTPTEDDLREY